MKMKKTWEFLSKYVGPAILGAATMDSWYNGRLALIKDKFLHDALERGLSKEKALEEANRKAIEYFQMLKVKLTATSDRLSNSTNLIKDYGQKIADINKEIAKDPQNIDNIQQIRAQYYLDMYQQAVKQQEADIKEIQSLSTMDLTDILKSDLSELFNNFIDNINIFLSTLTSDQLVMVFNLTGYSMLLSTLNSITIILIGDQIIKWLKLEI